MTRLSPDARLAAAAIDVLTYLSRENLAGIRRAPRRGGGTLNGTSYVARWLLRDLADAVEAAYPGTLDATLAELARREAEDRDSGPPASGLERLE